MHQSHNKVYVESLWTELETLQLVLDEIPMLLRRINVDITNNGRTLTGKFYPNNNGTIIDRL